ncbi:helix-turn-helix transcriptional regulator [Methylobacterium radiodurans]|uniref:HTH cro/C1-type domain-containing protein n=1 Tax=Methylobacterium radiodurans TaxID=2202828 RepID=A0A2U8VQ85_9HYPH|nr:helix-turn-helix transcriptional regulator [Methylobacterium radiodurans]AWN35785.1 hypothetical protein DK427_08515 [Methylobacterium radiodurans]
MYTNTQKRSSPQTQALRKQAGQLLKNMREEAGHSQRSFAAAIGAPIHTFVSQIERGLARIPPDQFRIWARACGLDARPFLVAILPFYEPDTAALLFGDAPPVEGRAALPDLDRALAEANAIVASFACRPNERSQDTGLATKPGETPQAADTRCRREDLGRILKHLRERAGHPQRAFASLVGASSYTFVSLVETGRNRLPPEQTCTWAAAYGMDARTFLLVILRFYDPETFAILFGNTLDIDR